MPEKDWDPKLYAATARYVSDHGAAVIDWLQPRPGERILDLGCGDGALTEALVAAGAEVVAVDSSAAMVDAARERGLDAHVMDARRLEFDRPFGAVFTNAALHWVREADDVVRGVAAVLGDGGRYVGEFGGRGNVAHVCAALREALARRGVAIDETCGWYFPSAEEYAAVLRRYGLEPLRVELIPRPTPIPGDAVEWLANFGGQILSLAPESERQAILDEVNRTLAPRLVGDDGVWRIDYVRIRFEARLSG